MVREPVVVWASVTASGEEARGLQQFRAGKWIQRAGSSPRTEIKSLMKIKSTSGVGSQDRGLLFSLHLDA